MTSRLDPLSYTAYVFSLCFVCAAELGLEGVIGPEVSSW